MCLCLQVSVQPRLYCHFHKDCRYETNECKHLKSVLEDSARQGEMNSYLPLRGKKFQKKDDHQSKKKLRKVKALPKMLFWSFQEGLQVKDLPIRAIKTIFGSSTKFC